MGLIQLIIGLVVIGVVLYLINHYLPLDPPIKMIINVVIILVICLWLLSMFGILPHAITVRQ